MDVAIVGIGCKCPGGIDNIEELWNVLLDKRDVITQVPLERWDTDAIMCMYKELVGKNTLQGIRYGGFMSPEDCSALTSFADDLYKQYNDSNDTNSNSNSIGKPKAKTATMTATTSAATSTPATSTLKTAQSEVSCNSLYERLLLYTTYRACLDYEQAYSGSSGSPSGSSGSGMGQFQGLRDKKVGYFVGGPGLLNKSNGEPGCRQNWVDSTTDGTSGSTTTTSGGSGRVRDGDSLHGISSRVAKVLGLSDTTTDTGTNTDTGTGTGSGSTAAGTGGPVVTTDTACSSSLVAMQLAIDSLNSGESDVAVVAAAHVVRLEMSVACAVAG